MSASLVGSEMCIRDSSMPNTCGRRSCKSKARNYTTLDSSCDEERRSCTCLLYTSDAADDM
eukprot:10801940-Alexandrium_andersonii.AAC.1